MYVSTRSINDDDDDSPFNELQVRDLQRASMARLDTDAALAEQAKAIAAAAGAAREAAAAAAEAAAGAARASDVAALRADMQTAERRPFIMSTLRIDFKCVVYRWGSWRTRWWVRGRAWMPRRVAWLLLLARRLGRLYPLSCCLPSLSSLTASTS